MDEKSLPRGLPAQELLSNSADSAQTSSPNDATASSLSHDHVLPRRTEIKWYAAIYLLMFSAGWSDASIGPLLLRIQEEYSVSYSIVSLIFISNFVGFFAAALCNVWFTERLGLGKTLALGAFIHACAAAIFSGAPPFPLFVIGFCVNGFGLGLQDAQVNSFITRLPNATSRMSIAHAVYGLGALVSPIIATQFAKPEVKDWHFHYLCSVGLMLLNTLLLAYTFRGLHESELFARQHYTPVVRAANPADEKPQIASDTLGELEQTAGSIPSPDGVSATMKQIAKTPFVHLAGILACVYVGIEFTIGSWAVTFIIEERGGNSDSGYISTGFFGGLMMGRVLHVFVAKVLSEQVAVLSYIVIALALQIVVWVTKSVIANAIVYAAIGLVLGPIFPVLINATAAVLDPKLTGGAVGYISALGQCGSALFPFITGALAGSFGVISLQPLSVALLASLAILWMTVLWMSRHRWQRTHRF